MAQEESHFKLWQRKEKHREICHHSACSLDLMHIVSLSDGSVKERERESYLRPYREQVLSKGWVVWW